VSQATFHVGDALTVLRTLEAGSVDLVITSPPFLALRSYLPADHPDKAKEMGSEPDPGAYVDGLMVVVEELRRVLAPHGSLCIELGDTYSGGKAEQAGIDRPQDGGYDSGDRVQYDGQRAGIRNMDDKIQPGGANWPLAKSLSLIPETVRFTMAYGRNPHTGRQTEPWRIRNVIRWVRPNPPVGALGDKFRPATSEMLVACVSAKRYFDLDAVREPFAYGENGGGSGATDDGHGAIKRRIPNRKMTHAGAPPLDWWKIQTRPYKGAHYAAFPEQLITKPVKAMSPEKVCKTCGEPSRRIVEANRPTDNRKRSRVQIAHRTGGPWATGGADRQTIYDTLGWSDCGHDNWRPGRVLDPFCGTGTVLQVATGHSRDAIGVDLDPRNADLALERVGPLFMEVIR